MNLYKIIFSHHGPKDSEEGIKTLLLAENDEQVYDWLASEPDGCFLFWKERMEDPDDEWFDENGDPEDWKARMIRLKGEINDDDRDFSDAYYGLTFYGWEMIDENVNQDKIDYLISIGFCISLIHPGS